MLRVIACASLLHQVPTLKDALPCCNGAHVIRLCNRPAVEPTGSAWFDRDMFHLVQAILPIALGFAGGCMIWMVFAELLPDALEEAPQTTVASAATISAACLEGVRMAIASLETPDGLLQSPVPGSPGVLLPALLVVLLAAVLPAVAGG